jgi:hypothetical protein
VFTLSAKDIFFFASEVGAIGISNPKDLKIESPKAQSTKLEKPKGITVLLKYKAYMLF